MYSSAKVRQFKPANDTLARPIPRRVSVVILPHNPNPAWHVLMGFLLLLSLGMVGLTFWLLHKGSAPVVVKMPPLKSEIRFPLDVEIVRTPVKIVAAPVVSTPAQQPASVAATVQPAPTISVPASALSETAAPADNQIVTKLAEQITGLPALHNIDTTHFVATGTDDSDALQSQASQALHDARYEEALAFYNQILAKNSYNHQALTGKIYALARKGNVREAIETSRLLLEKFPHDDITEANLAQLLAESGKNDEALRYLDRAARDAPDNLNYRLKLAALYDHTQHSAEALMLYRQIITATEQEEAGNLPLSDIRQRISYLESLGSLAGASVGASATMPSITRPLDN